MPTTKFATLRLTEDEADILSKVLNDHAERLIAGEEVPPALRSLLTKFEAACSEAADEAD